MSVHIHVCKPRVEIPFMGDAEFCHQLNVTNGLKSTTCFLGLVMLARCTLRLHSFSICAVGPVLPTCPSCIYHTFIIVSCSFPIILYLQVRLFLHSSSCRSTNGRLHGYLLWSACRLCSTYLFLWVRFIGKSTFPF